MLFEIMLNSKWKKTLMFSFLLFLSAVAIISSTFGWFFADRFPYGNGTYYNGFERTGLAGLILSIMALFVAIVISTVQVFSDGFWENHEVILYTLIIFLVLLLIPSLVMGILSLFEIDNIRIIVNRKL